MWIRSRESWDKQGVVEHLLPVLGFVETCIGSFHGIWSRQEALQRPPTVLGFVETCMELFGGSVGQL